MNFYKNENYDPMGSYQKVCPLCQREFMATHLNQKFCKDFEGLEGFCKDHYNHPRKDRKDALKEMVKQCLQDTYLLGRVKEHFELVFWFRYHLHDYFDEVFEEFSVGDQDVIITDLCVRENNIEIGVQAVFVEDIDEDVTSFVSELLIRLCPALLYFKEQIIIAVGGTKTDENEERIRELQRLLEENGFEFVFIQETT